MSDPAATARKQAFADFVVESMADLAPVAAKRMFGGFGVFRHGLMFAITVGEQLYFKTDEETAPRFTACGLLPLRYEVKGRGRASLHYHEAPPEVFDDPRAMCEWGAMAYECAVRRQSLTTRKRSKTPEASSLKKARKVASSHASGSGASPAHEAHEAHEPHGSAEHEPGRLADLPHVGVKSAAMLAHAGIRTQADLRQAGAVVAYARTKAVCPQASLNLLWALEGALSGRDWREVAETDRAALLMALEDVQRHML